MGQGLLFTPLTCQVKNFTKHTKQNPRGAVFKGAVQTGRKVVLVVQGHAQWVQCAKIMSLSSGTNLLFPRLPEFWPSGDFQHSRIPSSGSCQAKGVFPQIQCPPQKPSASRDLASIPIQDNSRELHPIETSPRFNLHPCPTYLLHSLTGLFPREISKVLAY